ncbi:hypothetical protein BCR34DRAFT_666675 [Clohesyomyces aquaticus]|uniref:Gfo/Idh/MocA-like oxidoreductase N-terminal domain-containing protein n=1 Tax=Clohesyomyces aquaticus TaxID=1231657 RepID=A0A1Y1Z7N4_9PLEO|nr:hypothetical protein BCR34DRAFT_666675 [Clohesyomyces aquaticus]
MPLITAPITPPSEQASKPFRFLLVGVGPHAKRTFIKHLKVLKGEGKAELVAAIDVIPNQARTEEYAAREFPGPELIFVPMFRDPMPPSVSVQLDEVVTRLQVDCVIISAEPECHKAYGLWAIRHGLHVIMDKPITVRRNAVKDIGQAAGISDDYRELLAAYTELQTRKETFFLINSHRRYHPGFYCTSDMISEIQRKTGCPVTNLVSTHCDGLWRLPGEIVDQHYHPFKYGYGKLAHSGYHFLDTTYLFMKAGWTGSKRPDEIEVVSSFLMPNGFMRSVTNADHQNIFGEKAYDAATGYSAEELRELMDGMGEYDAMLQVSFKQQGEVISTAHINLLHTGFSRRSWLENGSNPDLYKGVGRVKHEAHEVRSGPFQTIVIDSRQANDKHDRSKPSTAELGSDNHFEVQTWRNCDVLGEKEPLKVYTVADLDRRYDTKLPGIYSENVKRGILWEAVDYMNGNKTLGNMSSNLPDHSIPAALMSAAYASHVRRSLGLNPVTHIDLAYSSKSGDSLAMAELREEDLIISPQEDATVKPRYQSIHSMGARKVLKSRDAGRAMKRQRLN